MDGAAALARHGEGKARSAVGLARRRVSAVSDGYARKGLGRASSRENPPPSKFFFSC